MAETVVYECGHFDGKGVCERGAGGWSCGSCLRAAGRHDGSGILVADKAAVKCSICGGSGKIVKIIK